MPSTSPSTSPDQEATPSRPSSRRRGTALGVATVGLVVVVVVVGVAGVLLLRPGGDDELMEPASGGEGTVFSSTRDAFGRSARNLSNDERRTFAVGDSFFTQSWVTAPASTEARDGLGPLFNAPACASCHVLDGRAQPPIDDAAGKAGLLFRVSVPGTDTDGGPLPDPTYGGQLQDRAVLGVEPEGRIVVGYEETTGAYPDGTQYSMRTPVYQIEDLAYGPLAPEAAVSPRIAPSVFGAGLLEAVAEEDVLDRADPNDDAGDGISGRPNYIVNGESGEVVLGRFGWKANVPTVRQQVAGAFNGDVGVTSPPFPDENCPPGEETCLAAPNGGSPEIDDELLDKVSFYTSTLAVPGRRNLDDPDVAAGARLFADAGCEACHRATFVTGDHDIEALAHQEIHPFTDLLLHDMGDELADGRPDFLASGSEWRTPPLWGIGLTETVNGHTTFLHDGRARSLEEAILWHGGEADAARTAFTELSAADRARLVAFVESL